VDNIHTAHPDEPPGNTLFHHSFLVEWQLATKSGEEPEPPLPQPVDENNIREQAWNHLYPTGVNYNPTAAFQAVARERGYGAPTTQEFDVDDYRVQGFVLKILYAQIGDWDNVKELDW